jgi:AcrR family transcriptional regulator
MTIQSPVPASQRTRRDLMDASVRLFAARGFELTTVQEIVAEAGVTKGAFYHHFSSKDDVLFEIHEDFITSLLERTQVVLDRKLRPRQALAEIIREMLVSFEMFNEAVSVFLREHRSLSAEAHDRVRAKRDMYERMLIELIEEGIRVGDFRPLSNVRLVAFGINGMCVWAHEWFDPHKDLSATKIAELYADVVMNGLVATTD